MAASWVSAVVGALLLVSLGTQVSGRCVCGVTSRKTHGLRIFPFDGFLAFHLRFAAILSNREMLLLLCLQQRLSLRKAYLEKITDALESFERM